MEKFEAFPVVEQVNKKKENKLENIVTIETENATYDIVYSVHTEMTDPKSIEGVDGVILEMMTDLSDEKGVKDGIRAMQKRNLNPYEAVMREAAKKGKPLFLLDISKGMNEELEMEERDNESSNIRTAEYALGALAAMYGITSVSKAWTEKKMSRRQFLKFGASVAASAYFMSPLFQYLAGDASTGMSSRAPDEGSTTRKAEKFIETMNYAIHPELRDLTVDMRNDLISQKSETVALQLKEKFGKKPKLAIIIGAAHTGIERSLQKFEDDRIEDISNELGSRMERESRIARVDLPRDFYGNIYDAKISISQDERLFGKQ